MWYDADIDAAATKAAGQFDGDPGGVAVTAGRLQRGGRPGGAADRLAVHLDEQTLGEHAVADGAAFALVVLVVD